jgi:hypothetical protein
MGQSTTKRIESIQTQIQELEKQQKQLLQRQKAAERKARTHRLCKRGGEIEKLLPGIETLTEEEFRTFVKRVILTEDALRTLTDLLANKASEKAVEETVNTVQEREDSSLVLTQTLTVRNAEGAEIAPAA